VTVKTILQECENLKGRGRLLDPKSGQPLTDVDYTVVRYNEIVETFGPTHRNVEGGGQVKVYVTHADLPDFSPSRLTLELKDGRRVTGVFKKLPAGLLCLVKRGGFDESSDKS
jgi:hypothetical protein